MFASFDWPSAAVTIAIIASLVLVYAIAKLSQSAVLDRLDRLHVRMAVVEERANTVHYGQTELRQRIEKLEKAK